MNDNKKSNKNQMNDIKIGEIYWKQKKIVNYPCQVTNLGVWSVSTIFFSISISYISFIQFFLKVRNTRFCRQRRKRDLAVEGSKKFCRALEKCKHTCQVRFLLICNQVNASIVTVYFINDLKGSTNFYHLSFLNG